MSMQLTLPGPPQRPWSRRLSGVSVSIAAHALVAALVLLPSEPPRRSSAGAPPAPQVVRVAADPAAERPGAPRSPATAIDHDAAPLDFGAITVDTSKIRRRMDRLFPFLTEDLQFVGHIEQQASRPRLRYGTGPRRASAGRPPLVVDDATVQAIVDRAWSRQGRWDRFQEIASLLERHDPDVGRLAAVLHAYLDQNLLQPYHDTRGREPWIWAMLALAADHADFVDLAAGYAARVPSSRVTTELLFLLDELVQGSRDALLVLLTMVPERDLLSTAANDRAAYRLLVQLQRRYEEVLRERRLTPASVVSRFDDVRLRLLGAITRSAPEGRRAGDARYLAGQIHFERGNLTAALMEWDAIVPDARDSYFDAYSELQQELRVAAPYAIPAKAIAVLSGERARWLEFSRARLRRFGYTFGDF